jgi:hypothetical protein
VEIERNSGVGAAAGFEKDKVKSEVVSFLFYFGAARKG